MSLRILAISYAKRALETDSRERDRLRLYADRLREYHVIVFTRAADGFPAIQTDGSLHLYATNANSRVGMVWAAIRIGKNILKHSTEQFVVSSQDPFESSFVARRILRKKDQHHVQIHGDVFNPYSSRTSLLQRMRAWYGKRIVKRAQHVRVVSQRIKRSLLQLSVPEGKISVLPIQSDLEPFLAAGRTRQSTERSVAEPLQLLYMGRLAPEKSLEMLLRACAMLQQSKQSFRLQIVGDGPEKQRLEELVSQLRLDNEVSFVSWTNNPAEEMAEADVFCLTSNHEGWAMVLQEAAATGLAIVTTDVGCVGELIIDKESCLAVPVGDIAAYASALEAVADWTTRQRLSSAALEVAQRSTLSPGEYLTRWIASHGMT